MKDQTSPAMHKLTASEYATYGDWHTQAVYHNGTRYLDAAFTPSGRVRLACGPLLTPETMVAIDASTDEFPRVLAMVERTKQDEAELNTRFSRRHAH